jgi:hypothetical protein
VHDFLEGVETWGWVIALSKSVFWYGLATVLHYFSFFTLTGAAVAFDLFLLGLLAKGEKATDFADQLFPWIWTSMIVAIISGFTLAIVAAGDYYAAPTPRWKVTVVFIAVLVTWFIRRSVKKWGEAPAMPAIAKIAAVLSILLWLTAIMGGNDIAALCGLG